MIDLKNKDIKIAVLCGGMSNERDVSLRSGKKVYESLIKQGFKNSVLIDVDENVASKLKDAKIEYAYNALHGKFGEDGCIQGLLEILKIPYTGCGVLSSSICMDKAYTKLVLAQNKEIPLIKSVLLGKDEKNIVEKVKDLNFPLMLKPVCEGSSIGMFCVNDEKELVEKFDESIKCNQDILIEEYIEGTSCTVGVLEIDKKLVATEVLGFKTKTKWYDFEAKYTPGLTKFVMGAGFDSDLKEKVKDIAIKAFQACKCKDVSRVDFLVDKNQIPYVLEINTSPGMTDLSDLPAQSLEIGLDYDNLVLNILNGCNLNK
ncbi:MAG: D-alanine--D-alanine ligase [Candidatus Gastranaerophilales bacterium]|nr:D-alanine--D-alanine ligase [Candidatus Gastranaerophilales bacterium]